MRVLGLIFRTMKKLATVFFLCFSFVASGQIYVRLEKDGGDYIILDDGVNQRYQLESSKDYVSPYGGDGNTFYRTGYYLHRTSICVPATGLGPYVISRYNLRVKPSTAVGLAQGSDARVEFRVFDGLEQAEGGLTVRCTAGSQRKWFISIINFGWKPGIDKNFCKNSGVISLRGLVNYGTLGGVGGDEIVTFSGDGVVFDGFNYSFDPSKVSGSSAAVTAQATFANGITNESITFNVVDETLNLPSSQSFCNNSPPIVLNATPSGGTWSGPGYLPATNQFDPSQAGGDGQKVLTYTYTNAVTGCVFSKQTIFNVASARSIPLPPTVLKVCDTSPPVNLVEGFPAENLGGVWTSDRPGMIDGTNFVPNKTSLGNHILTYTFGTGTCRSNQSRQIEVVRAATVNLPGPVKVCSNGDFLVLTGESVAGGVYTGENVSSVTVGANTVYRFNPSGAIPKKYIVTYSVPDNSGGVLCNSVATREIEVVAPPVVRAGDNDKKCAGDADFVLTGGTPIGGTYTGSYVSNGTFEISKIPGDKVSETPVRYTFTDDATKCTNFADRTVRVIASAVVKGGDNLTVCKNGGVVDLASRNGVEPTGGRFTGTGIAGSNSSSFDPASVAVGDYTITYEVTGSAGCSGTATFVVKVVDPETITPVPPSTVCINQLPIDLLQGAFPAGGDFLGPGVTGSRNDYKFNPGVAGEGSHNIIYRYVSANGCVSTSTRTFIVTKPPTITVGANATLCLGSLPFDLSEGASVSGGSWTSKDGLATSAITAGIFYPNISGVGTFPLEYTVVQPNGCSSSTSRIVTVIAVSGVNAGTDFNACKEGGSIDLASRLGVTPSGGTFSWTGGSGNSFNPAGLVTGTYAITYTVSSGTCSGTDVVVATVVPSPSVSAGAPISVCSNQTPFDLSEAVSIRGGRFTGQGVKVDGLTFDPSKATLGANLVIYQYTDLNGCTGSSGRTITVNPPPVVNVGDNLFLCRSNTAVDLSVGATPGGTWTGSTAISGSFFDPQAAGVGVFTLTYTVTQANGCSSSATRVISVAEPQVVQAGDDFAICRDGSSIDLASRVSPAGGVFLGTGVSGTNFNPLTAGVGSFTITYAISAGACSGSDSFVVTVNPLPSVSAGSPRSVCLEQAPFDLAASASPSGGTFTGPGVSVGSTMFNPGLATLGVHTITYTVISDKGCKGTGVRTITVTTPPSVTVGENLSVCVSSTPIDLSVGAAPAGGTWSGSTAITAGIFDPVTAGAGIYELTYTVLFPGGCMGSAKRVVSVSAAGSVNAGDDLSVCQGSGTVDLASRVSPSGGTFSGTGVSGNSFNPTVAGSYTITYTVGSGACSGSDRLVVTVVANPVVNAGADRSLCLSEPSLDLSLDATPSGGVFSGRGVVNGVFYPSLAGIGEHIVSYSYSANGCSASDQVKFTVTAPPTVTVGANLFLCLTSAPVDLFVGVSPLGGTWSGSTAVTDGIFDPVAAGNGTYSLTYTVVSPSGCTSSARRVVSVAASVAVNAGPDLRICQGSPTLDLSSRVSPSGGTFSGTGISGTNFNSTTSGTFTISYTVSAGSCSGTDSFVVTVIPNPVVNAGADRSFCTNDSGIDLTSGASPAGGTFTGTGVVGTTFNPSVANIGAHNITYTVTNADGCSSSDVRVLAVTAPPAVTVGSNLFLCLTSAPVDLSVGASPTGGTWTGSSGISSGLFDPSKVAVGNYVLNYSVVFPGGCPVSVTRLVSVAAAVTVNAGPDFRICQGSPTIDLASRVSPSGGTFSGTGISGNNFNPTTVGTFTITYTVSAGTCSGTDSFVVTVIPNPVVNAGADRSFCVNQTTFDLASGASPSGGVFTGTGVVGTEFKPNVAGIGLYTVTYTVVNSDGCSGVATRLMTVTAPPTVQVGENLFLCPSSPAIDLSLGASPSGGLWSGSSAITAGIFDPTSAGVGTYTLTYTVSFPTGCVSSAQRMIRVLATTVLDVGEDKSLCKNATPYLLSVDVPVTGGVWTGNGISGSTFSPSLAGVGDHNLIYTYTDGNACTSVGSRIFTVLEVPPLSAGPSITVCISESQVNLANAGFPINGTWSGQGISGALFLPPSVGVGAYDINYSYTFANSCTSVTTKKITVAPLPVVGAGTDFDLCINANPLTLAGGTPASGSWSGPSVVSGVFDPFSAGLGSKTLRYTYADANGCSKFDEVTVRVLETPLLEIGGDFTTCENNNPVNLLTEANIKGGTFSGTGIVGAVFNPTIAKAGTHTITYNVRFNGCDISAFRNILVAKPDVLNIGGNKTICIKADRYDMSIDLVTPGGTFSGKGVTGDYFNPSLAGFGSHVITYTLTNAFSCTSSTTRVMTVQNQLDVDAGADLVICKAVGTVDLKPRAKPLNGIFVGPGVVNNVFDPILAGVGVFDIEYIVDNGNGCISSDKMAITVKESSILNFGTDSTLCINAAPLVLNFSDELKGGTWSGAKGLVNNSFYPTLAGVGTFPVFYTNPNIACAIAGQRKLTVVGLPQKATSTVKTISGCKNAFVTLSAALKEADKTANGTIYWYREGVAKPIAIGEDALFEIIGDEKITYRAANKNGCVSIESDFITVKTANPSAMIAASTTTIGFGKPVQFFAKDVVNTSVFKWDFGDGLISYDKNPWHYYYESGSFDVQLNLTSLNGCESIVRQPRFMTVAAEPKRGENVTGDLKEDAVENEIISVYPIPASGEVNVQMRSSNNLMYQVNGINTIGQTFDLGKKFIQKGENNITLDVSALAQGLYKIVLVGAKGTVSFKIIKQ